MEMLEKLQVWLASLPFWEGEPPRIDKLPVKPEDTGLFPQGGKLIARREDVLGNVTLTYRHSFLLKRTASAGMAAEDFLEKLWQSAKKAPPSLGQKAFYPQGGKYQKTAGTGLGTYEIQLIAEMEETL